MKFNMKQIPKIYRDILIAATACFIFLTGFWYMYEAKLQRDLEKIKMHIEKADYKYMCIGSYYDQQMRKQKREENKVNIAILRSMKQVSEDGLFVYFSQWATFGRAEKRYVISRRLATDILAVEPPFCIKIKD